MVQQKSILDQLASQAGLGSITGSGAGAQQDAHAVSQAGGIDLQSLLNGKGGLATGALAGGLAGILIGGKKSRKFAKSALKVGGVALAGGLAYKAWRDWQANKAPAAAAQPAQADGSLSPELTAPAGSPFLPATPAAEQDLTRVLIRAMIAATKADGHVSDEERRNISDRLAEIRLNAADMAFVDEEISKPLDIDVVAQGAGCPEQAAEIYTASLLVIDTNGAAEKGYLAMLAARLRLDPGLVEHLHANVDGLTEGAPA